MCSGREFVYVPRRMAQVPTSAYPGLESPGAIRLMGQVVHQVTGAEVIGHVMGELEQGRGGWIATHNLDHLRRLVRDREFASLCETADLRTADGKPLLWAAALQGTPLPERVAGSDLVWSLAQAAARAGRSVFLLGGNEGTAARAGEMLEARYPGLRVAGSYFPPFGYDRSEGEKAKLLDAVRAAGPGITYVALGSPRQERMIQELLRVHPGGWYVGVGISLSFITGEVRRAPGWMQRSGLEWVHRLVQEPGRLGRRYIVEGLPFGARLLLSSAMARGRVGERGAVATVHGRHD